MVRFAATGVLVSSLALGCSGSADEGGAGAAGGLGSPVTLVESSDGLSVAFVGVDDTGTGYVAVHSDSGDAQLYLHTPDAGFSAPTPIPEHVDLSSIALDPSGILYARDRSTPPEGIQLHTYDGSWRDVEYLTAPENGVARLALAPNGDVVVVWKYLASGAPDALYGAIYRPGTGWLGPFAAPLPAVWTSIHNVGFEAGDGAAIVAWEETTSDAARLVAARLVYDSGWTEPVELSGSGISAPPRIAIDPSGNAVMGWHDSDLRSARYTTGSGFSVSDGSLRAPGSSHEIVFTPDLRALATWIGPLDTFGAQYRVFNVLAATHDGLTEWVTLDVPPSPDPSSNAPERRLEAESAEALLAASGRGWIASDTIIDIRLQPFELGNTVVPEPQVLDTADRAVAESSLPEADSIRGTYGLTGAMNPAGQGLLVWHVGNALGPRIVRVAPVTR